MNQKDDVIASLNNLEQDEKLSTMLDKQLIFIQDTNNTRDYNINMSVFNTNSLTLDGTPVYNQIQPGKYRTLYIEILDQNFNALQILDPNILINLSVIKNI